MAPESDRELVPNNTPGIVSSEIEYEADKQQQRIAELLDEWKLGPKDSRTLSYVVMRLNSLQIQFKNPAFSEEKEHRLVTSPLILSGPDDGLPIPQMMFPMSGVDQLKHREANGRITAYFELPFAATAVREIFLGPKNEFAEFDLSSFLSSNELRHVDVSRSAATYR